MTTRTPIGNYNKYVGYALAWFLRRHLPKGSTLLLRGRGTRKNWKGERLGTRHGIPLKDASRMGIYVLTKQPVSITGFAYKTFQRPQDTHERRTA